MFCFAEYLISMLPLNEQCVAVARYLHPVRMRGNFEKVVERLRETLIKTVRVERAQKEFKENGMGKNRLGSVDSVKA